MQTLLFHLYVFFFFFCNCVDNFFCELHLRLYLSNQIAMAVIADEIDTVLGLSKNNYCVCSIQSALLARLVLVSSFLVFNLP